jgi:hypothetical protein
LRLTIGRWHSQRAFWNLRPGGVKIHAGAPVIESEMVEDDFKELAAAGVKLLGEVGLGGVTPPATRVPEIVGH